MNVMLTCAGRRNYLVRYFQQALGNRGQVLATDANPYAPALQESDKAFVVPPFHHADYIDILLGICRAHDVGLLIPLHDVELPLFARQRAKFLEAGVRVAVSSPQVVDTCWDKWAGYAFMERCGLRVPRTYLSIDQARRAVWRGEVTFPFVLKPRWGTASLGIEYAENDAELEWLYYVVQRDLSGTFLAEIGKTDPEMDILIQERLRGEEYGLDVINDLDSCHTCVFVRRKLSMRAGETDRAVTVEDERLHSLGTAIGGALGHVGNLDVDVIVQDGTCYVLEMNPRFGGGYPFSHAAGANIPAALVAWASGQEPDKEWFEVRANVRAAKCPRLVVIERAAEVTIDRRLCPTLAA